MLPDRFQPLGEFQTPDGALLHRARDRVLGREVVLKLPTRPDGAPAPTPAERERSLREARALARVQNPHVVRLFDVIETPEGPLLVLQPVAGETLAERLAAQRKLTPAETVAIATQVTQALEAVHALGIVHRGVSAATIVLEPDGNALLSGFTFAKSAPGLGAIPGTSFLYLRDEKHAHKTVVEPPHPAPEQLRGEAADARSDVFGLGWVLYECLAGEPPYPIELDVKHWRAPRPIPGLAKSLDRAVAGCLAVDPAQRFASAAAVRAALQNAGAASGGGWSTGRKLAAAAGVVALAAGALAVRALLVEGEDPIDAADRGAAVRRADGAGAAGAALHEPRYTASRALLIGIGQEYAKTGWTPLPNAEHDVAALAKRLRELPSAKWKIDTLLGAQATKEGIESAIRKLSHEAARDDQLFVFYAGHGEPGKGEMTGFIVPAGAKTLQDDPQQLGWLRFDEFANVFRETQAKHVLVAMDCCYGGRLAEEQFATRSAVRTFEQKFLRERAHVVITSGAGNDRVSDGRAGENSPFAQAFLDQLARDAEAITSAELFSAVVTKLAPLPGQSPRTSRPTRDASGEVVFFLR
jgi:hypothetical protein